jgi:hypothetical protein
VTDPIAPPILISHVTTGSFYDPGSASGIDVSGSRAFVGETTGGGELLGFDVSNPAQPQLVATSHDGGASDVLAVGVIIFSTYVGGSTAITGGSASPTGGLLIRQLVEPPPPCGTADFNCDGDVGTDADIEAFFSCLAGACPAAPCANSADFNGDGDVGTDADIEAFFRVLAGGTC